MMRSKRLLPLVEIAQLKSRQGMQAVAYMQKRVEAEQEKLRQLLICAAEYREAGKNKEKQTVNSQSLKSLRQFKENVALAIQQQSGQIKAVESQLEQVRVHWRSLDARSKSLEKTRSRLVTAENIAIDKIEQREMDERASQSAQNRAGF
jgi:flagellar export protein FliJ